MTILISARIATIAALAIGTLAACSPDQAADNRQQTRLATLHSTSITLPEDDQTFGDGAALAPLNAHCLACHSATMVLYQPRLTAAQWQAIVDKMRDAYGAPIPAGQAPVLVDALISLQTRHADGR